MARNCICCPLSFTLLTFCLAGLGTSTPGQSSAQSPPYPAEQTWGPGLQGEKITAMCKTAPHTIGGLDRQSGALEELDIEGNEGEADFWVLKGAILFLILWLAGMARRGDLCGKSFRLLSAAFWILLPNSEFCAKILYQF